MTSFSDDQDEDDYTPASSQSTQSRKKSKTTVDNAPPEGVATPKFDVSTHLLPLSPITKRNQANKLREFIRRKGNYAGWQPEVQELQQWKIQYLKEHVLDKKWQDELIPRVMSYQLSLCSDC